MPITIIKSSPTARTVHVNRPLTNISVAYMNNEYIYPQVFPQVPVTNKSDSYFQFDRSAFYKVRSGMRAPGTRAPMGDYGITTASFLCINDALGAIIPDEMRDNADAPLKIDLLGTRYVSDGLELGEEVRVAAKIAACASWASASNPGTAWSSDSSDPYADILTVCDAIVKQIGRMPNVAVTNWTVWRRLQNHPNFLERLKYTRPGGTLATTDVTNWFWLDKLLIGKSIYDSANEGATTSMGFVWGNNFWVGYVPQSPALEEPAAGYVFRWGNREIRRLRLEPEHATLIEGQWFTSETITASEAGAGMYGCV